jgi:hypothetical protein
VPIDDKPETLEVLHLAALSRLAVERSQLAAAGSQDTELLVGAIIVRQWADGAGPVSPVGRVALTLADILLEYIGSDPSALGLGGKGGKLIGAFATNLSLLIPDDQNFGERRAFGRRLVGVFLQAGLRSLNEHVDLVVADDHLAALVKNSLPPVIASLPQTSIAERLDFEAVAQALIGPAASAAIATVAANPSAFLGKRFDSDKAVGALTAALLTQAAETGLRRQFTADGLLGLYRAALGVAANRPDLFIKGDGEELDLARAVFKTVAERFRDAKPPFDGDFAAGLTASVLETAATFAPRFVDAGDDWQATAADVAAAIVNGLAAGLRTDRRDPFRTLFSKDQLLELGRIFVAHAAATPSMIAGRNESLQALVRAVARSMAADERLLLSGDDWMEIARVAALEAAANPGRLFHIGDGQGSTLAEQLVTTLLNGAAAALATHNQSGRAVLYGQTLRAAIIVSLQTMSGRPAELAEHQARIAAAVETLNALIDRHGERFGSREWLQLFKLLIAGVASDEPFPLSAERAHALLAGATS